MLENDRVRQEQALRAAVLAGDRDAWRAFYDSAYEPLWKYALWRCAGLADLAEEITQETWLVAVRRIADFDPRRARFVSWLRGIAALTMQNHFRVRRRRAAESIDNRDVPEPLGDVETPERIAQALTALPERYETALRAKYLDGMSVEQIAAERQETIKAVESLLSRARQAFRAKYEELTASDVLSGEAES